MSAPQLMFHSLIGIKTGGIQRILIHVRTNKKNLLAAVLHAPCSAQQCLPTHHAKESKKA
jgi:hypothetical protein